MQYFSIRVFFFLDRERQTRDFYKHFYKLFYKHETTVKNIFSRKIQLTVNINFFLEYIYLLKT